MIEVSDHFEHRPQHHGGRDQPFVGMFVELLGWSLGLLRADPSGTRRNPLSTDAAARVAKTMAVSFGRRPSGMRWLL